MPSLPQSRLEELQKLAEDDARDNRPETMIPPSELLAIIRELQEHRKARRTPEA